MSTKFGCLAALALLTLANLFQPAQAQIPRTLNYQGYLTSPSGAAINSASLPMIFKIYNVQTGGSDLHTETQSVTVSNGIFNVLLGTSPALTLPFDAQYFLGVTTGADPEMTPRQPLAASPYAIRAASAESLAASATVAGSQITGALNNATLPTAALTGLITGSQLASGLTLAGTTVGTFSGPLTGNVSGTAGSAASFTGTLAGDVTGPQATTVVALVSGVTAANVAAGANLANAATNANTASTLVRRDASGNFSAGTITAAGDLNLSATNASGTVGVINQGASRLHSFGSANFFAGTGAGNFSMGGGNNTGVGNTALAAITSGGQNTATGSLALAANSGGGQNTASGYAAMQANTGGGNNAAFGASALQTMTGGNFNTAVGGAALAALAGNSSNNIGIGFGAGSNLTTGNFNIDIGNAGVAGESNIIRIGTSQTDTYLTGVVHGDGSGLTNVPVNIANGSITSAMTGTGAAQFVRSIQVPNNLVFPGSAFTIDTQVFNSVPSSIVASIGASGTVFTLGATGTYVLDYEMSLGSAGSVGVYTGPTALTLVLDTNSIAGSTTSNTWIHGRTLVATGASPVVVAISPVFGIASVTTAGNAPGNYMIRLTVLKI